MRWFHNLIEQRGIGQSLLDGFGLDKRGSLCTSLGNMFACNCFYVVTKQMSGLNRFNVLLNRRYNTETIISITGLQVPILAI